MADRFIHSIHWLSASIPVTQVLLNEIEEQKACTHDKPDGCDVALYVCRTYCERALTKTT